MNITKRGMIRLCTLSAAVFAVLIVRNFQLMRTADKAVQKISYTYTRAAEDLADACDNLSSTLEKQMYASSGKMHQELAVQLYREAAAAKAALAQLPVAELQLENTYKFLSQVGNYSLAVSERLMNGEELSDEEYENISSLYEFSKSLSEDMWGLEGAISSGEISLVSDSKTADQEDPPSITNGFQDFENNFDSYPTLIYDGPFSDNILEKTPKMTANADEVTQETALMRASMALNVNSTDLPTVSDVEGTMPAWRFSDENSSVACEVTKQGGYISYFLKSRIVSESSINHQEAVEKAREFLDYLGILSMQTTYYEAEGNVLTINFAYNDVGKCVYTDLVKVSVALDNGEIMGYDARGFLVNHYERSYPENIISESRAKEEISPKLTVTANNMAVIPTDNLEEVLCYEFKCKAENGRNVLVYVNAQTGEEEQILILVESDAGTLTI